jgi:uncharacterized membrane protein YhiD involved in acid resistance
MLAVSAEIARAAAAAARPLDGQGWRQAGELALALVLSASVGLEREIRQKNAGLRTHTLVGVGAALFMLISKYGFTDVLQPGLIVLDPSRMAAQIVSGVGFLGAGLIFVRRDSVRGLTTAASIWVTATVGCTAGSRDLAEGMFRHLVVTGRSRLALFLARIPPDWRLSHHWSRSATRSSARYASPGCRGWPEA